MSSHATHPSEQEIRAALISRMDAYCEKANIAASSVCALVMNDTSFMRKVKHGKNFTVASYQRLMDFLDEHADGSLPPALAKKKKKNGSA